MRNPNKSVWDVASGALLRTIIAPMGEASFTFGWWDCFRGEKCVALAMGLHERNPETLNLKPETRNPKP